MLPEVSQAHSAVFAKGAHVLGRDTNVGQVVVSTAAIGQFHGVSSLSAAIEICMPEEPATQGMKLMV